MMSATVSVAVLRFAVSSQTASRVYRVGLLNPGEPLSDTNLFGMAIIRGFSKHGYVLGKTLLFARDADEE